MVKCGDRGPEIVESMVKSMVLGSVLAEITIFLLSEENQNRKNSKSHSGVRKPVAQLVKRYTTILPLLDKN